MKSKKSAGSKSIVVLVYLLCAGLLAILAGSNLFVLRAAGSVAEDVRADAERSLILNEVSRQIDVLARDQSQVSYWDDAVAALGKRINAAFVRDEIADWLFEDFGIARTVVIAADGTPRVAVFEDRVLAPAAGAAIAADNADLVAETQRRYMERRAPRGKGYVYPGDPLRGKMLLPVADLRSVEGEIGLMVAQAIIPDDEAVLPDGLAQTLVTFKPLDAAALAAIAEKLGFRDFAIVAAGASGAGESLPLRLFGETPGYVATWESSSPAAAIWDRTLPLLAVLLGLAAVSLVFIAMRYGRALAALHRSEAQNRFLALHDALTGLANRLHFDRALEDIIAEGAQDRCAILCVDLDRFKAVNDTYGHQAGDAVIVTVAHRIAETVGGAGLVARVGGDEFIVLLRDGLERDNVLWLCDSVIERVCEAVVFDGGSANVGASIGVAWWPDDALTAKTVIRSADEALYRAKEEGRGRAYLAGETGARAAGVETAAA